jgi:uncharacterized membrane protein
MEHQDGRAGAESSPLGFPKNRMEALTDGLFSIAMTLLVLGLAVPASSQDPSNAGIVAMLASLLPDFLHYLIAFFILASFWIAHHAQAHRLRYIDRRYLWINIFALMFVALVPFSTSLAGDYSNDTAAAIVFEVNLLIIGLLFTAQGWYATKGRQLVHPDTDIQTGMRRSMVVPAISGIAILFALAGCPWSTILYMFTPVVMALLPAKR